MNREIALPTPEGSSPPTRVAIVGSGPAACYLAQALLKALPALRLTLIDRLPVPYGLLRYGVAADHPGTKNVSRIFDRLFERQGVQFAGNLEVGRDVTLEKLRDCFDAVVLSTGLHDDIPLDVPGTALAGVTGAGSLTQAINGLASPTMRSFTAGRRVVVVGAGNVALDVVRLLAKRTDDLTESDADLELLDSISSDVQHIDLISRSPSRAARWDTAMLRELGTLGDVRFTLQEAPSVTTEPWEHSDPGYGRTDDEQRQVLQDLTERLVQQARVEVVLHFGFTPAAILGSTAVTGVRLYPHDDDSKPIDLHADSVVTAIGFRVHSAEPLAAWHAVARSPQNETGWLEPGLYSSGWFRTGPRGTIASQRVHAQILADQIAQELPSPPQRPALGLEGLDPEVRSRIVDWQGWKRIDQHERRHAAEGRPRLKLRDVDEMVAVALHPTNPQLEATA